ncbi:hypothetical protein [Halosaccharopolyspora lacisalsi]|uniref:hypothetical protein n=1 Tax=Halosaccharopolyspora lacisalsi TaxID=1000566 RepID=UPI0015FAA218|nr:hypothetical protein [Halosaccharopolyspora lacisalsi]
MGVPVGDGAADVVGESSWRKWLPGTVTSRWSVQVRTRSRWGPVRMAPGSALTRSLGTALVVSQSP